VDLNDVELKDLIAEIHKRCTESVLCLKPFGEDPYFYWKGYQPYCHELAREAEDILDGEEEEEEQEAELEDED
jgi:hypothetical protein